MIPYSYYLATCHSPKTSSKNTGYNFNYYYFRIIFHIFLFYNSFDCKIIFNYYRLILSLNTTQKYYFTFFLLFTYNFVFINTDQWIYIILLNLSTQSWNWMSMEFLYLTTTSISILFSRIIFYVFIYNSFICFKLKSMQLQTNI